MDLCSQAAPAPDGEDGGQAGKNGRKEEQKKRGCRDGGTQAAHGEKNADKQRPREKPGLMIGSVREECGRQEEDTKTRL